MKKRALLTLAVASTLLASTTAFAEEPNKPGPTVITPVVKPFTDVEIGNPYVKYITDLKQAAILSGNPDGSFGPTNSLTRAQFAVMLVKAFKLPVSSKQTKFTDAAKHWGKTYIESAFEAGIVAGTSNTTFSPEDTLTREQAAAMVWRYLKAHGVTPTTDTVTLSANTTDDWAKEAVVNTISKRLYGPDEVQQKTDGQDYLAKEVMTRQSAAALIDMALDALKPNPNDPTSNTAPTYQQHAGDNLHPVPIQKGMQVVYKSLDGTPNRTTIITDLLNPTKDASNVIYDATAGNYLFGNIGVVNVRNDKDPKYDQVMKDFSAKLNAGASYLSKVTFKDNGQFKGVTIQFPSLAGTGYSLKCDDNTPGGSILVMHLNSDNTYTVPMLYGEDIAFTFYVDADPTATADLKAVVGRETIIAHGNGTYSSDFATIDIN